MTLDLTQSLPSHVRATSGRPVEDSTLMEVWQGLSAAIVDQIADNWAATTERYAKGRQENLNGSIAVSIFGFYLCNAVGRHIQNGYRNRVFLFR